MSKNSLQKKQPEKYKERYSIDFEFVLMRFLGHKGYGLAGMYHNDKAVKKELLKVISKIRKQVDVIDTSNRHKEMLFATVDSVEKSLKQDPVNEYKNLSMEIFKLSSLLFGFTTLEGKFSHEVMYWQGTNAYLSESSEFQKGKNLSDVFLNNEHNVIALRKEVLEHLKSKNVNDNVIAQVLNTTEYQIKRLKKEYEK
jgi:hypothetical protein